MKPNKLYNTASVVFLVLSALVFSYSGYYIVGNGNERSEIYCFVVITDLKFDYINLHHLFPDAF
ncbi:hypothetical protein [Pedobacter kyonggii]|uniref:Uncharacterized protein n=1 Tax=Pedobacter kyonggii TaxID=1926871 RepID=A0A4Q9HAG2_9SPHI|nr:hypothetical protein [Pedobacter kyonggii]TBO40797.1 hypothetical protein EYS08_16875 [Pedobacter kyonggii]